MGTESPSDYLKSWYKLNSPNKKYDLNIWYTGENLRPPFNDNWDLILSFDNYENENKYFYLPFWATTLGNTVSEAKKNQERYLKPRVFLEEKKKFCSVVIGNPEPYRMHFLKNLEALGELGKYGTVFNNPIQDKKSIISQYKFNLCFENDLYPGYVTEKLFNAWDAHTLPIWWGLDPYGYINQDAIIDTTNRSFSEIRDELIILNNEDTLYKKRYCSPLLNKPFDYDELINFVSKSLAVGQTEKIYE
jgi:hypothetical protein